MGYQQIISYKAENVDPPLDLDSQLKAQSHIPTNWLVHLSLVPPISSDLSASAEVYELLQGRNPIVNAGHKLLEFTFRVQGDTLPDALDETNMFLPRLADLFELSGKHITEVAMEEERYGRIGFL